MSVVASEAWPNCCRMIGIGTPSIIDARVGTGVDPDGAHSVALAVEHHDRSHLEIDVLGPQGECSAEPQLSPSVPRTSTVDSFPVTPSGYVGGIASRLEGVP